MRIAISLFCVTAIVSSVPALSAQKQLELTEVSGKVLVTTADGALPAAVGQQLVDGTRIFVGDEAIAQVTSSDGVCTVTLPSKKVTVINYNKLCDVQITPTATDGGAGGVPPPVVGLAFFGVAAAAAIYATIDNDDDEPMSFP